MNNPTVLFGEIVLYADYPYHVVFCVLRPIRTLAHPRVCRFVPLGASSPCLPLLCRTLPVIVSFHLIERFFGRSWALSSFRFVYPAVRSIGFRRQSERADQSVVKVRVEVVSCLTIIIRSEH